MTNVRSAQEIILALGLQPHPEGGHFVETYRDTQVDTDGRAASSAIYFMLKAEEVSKWHKVDATEVWHHYSGAPLELTIFNAGHSKTIHILGPDLNAGQRPQAVVPAHSWQMARPLGGWVLVGCTVAPAFEFRGGVLATPGFEPPG